MIDPAQSFFLFLHGFWHYLHGVDQCHGIPAKGAEPEVVGKTGYFVAPEAFAGIVISVIIKSISQIPHLIVNGKKLLVAVLTVFSIVESQFILHIERLRHIKSVQPDLVRIDQFVPEIAGGGTGLAL